MVTWEFPLVLFTVLSQWAVGIAVMLTVVEYFMPLVLNETNIKHLRLGGMLVLPLVAVGLISSVFHLGQPLNAYRALLNLGNSKLSLEILAFLIVGILALAYSYLWWKAPEKGIRKAIGAALSIAGLAAIVISSKVYALPARLAWNSWQTTAAFLLTAVLLGTLSVAFLLCKAEDEVGLKSQKVLGWVILGTVILLVIVLATFAQTFGLSEEQSAAVAATFGSGFLLARLILSILLPVAIAGLFIIGKKSCQSIVAIGVLGAVLGEVAGRILFYSSVMGQYPWF